MANTYTSLHYHVVFSTKNREPLIAQEIEGRVWAYIGGIGRKHRMTALQVGGIEDHIHALVTAPAVLSPSEIAQYLKVTHLNGFIPNSREWVSSPGRTATERSRSAGPIFRASSPISRISASITAGSPFKRNTASCWKSMGLNMTSGISGASISGLVQPSLTRRRHSRYPRPGLERPGYIQSVANAAGATAASP